MGKASSLTRAASDRPYEVLIFEVLKKIAEEAP